jgi:hypothetical protein
MGLSLNLSPVFQRWTKNKIESWSESEYASESESESVDE